MGHTLQVFSGETLIFLSDGKWLYPLFELEDFLANADWEPATLTVRDKIVGRAAALLLIRLGIRDVRAGIMSRLGREALERYVVRYEYDTLVDRIDCRTEEMLVNEFDPDRAHAMLKQRAKR
jgi:zinc transport system ATP-binding protein